MADTLLSIVQDILAELEGDEVNSISDTVEAMQVATHVRSVFKDIIEEHDLPGHAQLFSLEGLGDTDKPTHMKLPDNVHNIEWLKYDNRIASDADKLYQDVTFMQPYDFVTYVNQRPSTDTTNYQVVQQSANLPLTVGKLDAPRYWTTFDNTYVIFDGYNSNVDSTLHAAKTQAYGFIRPTFMMADDHVPELPQNLMRNLYHQTLAKCFVNMKTVVNPKAERNENRFRIRSQRNKERNRKSKTDLPNYGR